jgi:hypothetical protein
MKNYLKLRTINPFRSQYIYIDTINCDADNIFISENLSVKFKSDYGNNEKYPDYIVVFCSIWKYDEKKFLKCLDKLKNKIILIRDNNYENVCDDFMSNIIKIIEENK